MSSANILIVGAGPTGLTAALELVRRKFYPRIIDKAHAPAEQSRAIGINLRSLDILAPSGVTPRLLEASLKIQKANFYSRTGKMFDLDFTQMPRGRDFMVALPQSETERILAARLAEMGCKVERCVELSDLTQENGHVRCSLENAGGAATTSDFDIVIGADGAHSRVRHALGVNFEGEAYEHDWEIADVRLSGLAADQIHTFDMDGAVFGAIPMPGGVWRIVANRDDVFSQMPAALRIEMVLWRSRFRISHRQVETYQKGNVFLAGDAAHIHSPAGGRGMNLGIEDASYLAYLIAENKTEDYTTLRHPVARQVINAVDTGTRAITSRNPFMRFARRNIIPLLLGIPFVERRAIKNLIGDTPPPPPWLA